MIGIARLFPIGTGPCTLPRVRPADPLWYLFAKRLLDILGATAAIVIATPIMVVAAIAVKLETPGPVFFKQYRLGRNGKPFLLYKIRSMTASAPDIRDSLENDNEASGPVFKIKADPRITRVGRILRKYSIDEMPQLFHVLFGQMSLVGPRPPIPSEVERYEPWQTERLAVKPGLTCIWQVSGRSDIGFDEWVRLDIEYVRNRNLWLDIKLLLLTIPAVLTARGAY